MLNLERFIEIEKSNRILMEKMSNIIKNRETFCKWLYLNLIYLVLLQSNVTCQGLPQSRRVRASSRVRIPARTNTRAKRVLILRNGCVIIKLLLNKTKQCSNACRQKSLTSMWWAGTKTKRIERKFWRILKVTKETKSWSTKIRWSRLSITREPGQLIAKWLPHPFNHKGKTRASTTTKRAKSHRDYHYQT